MSLTIYLYQLKKWNLYKLLFVLFSCFLIDDVFQLHQFASGFISNILKLNFKFNDMALGVGQLIYALIIVLLLLGASLWYYKLSSVLTQKAFLNIFLLLSFFLFFGVGVDVLHAFFKAQGQVSTVLTIIEEGGEMLTLSILVWYFCNAIVKHRVVETDKVVL
ncbi:hypothetical protein ACKGJY_06675 [Hyunsoonleella sp. 2307UL5-6]|uniref:hypothetical protein n=1 Tax=Hyunsoonleella sp. 2307UL5-6 TaxID=3384768 RepID=UPI0039BD1300